MDRTIVVDSLKTRYVDEGSGPVVLLLHGASLGSCVDVYEKNIPALVRAGFRVVGYDSPGYGLTDNPSDFSDAYRTEFVLRFMD
ncbi:MAG: alpha/beta hydrolase, partial [Deltaproteobacteria bacterium]|nr:alpha/beta hydrolase [Deltaproteobacteria bacterium]